MSIHSLSLSPTHVFSKALQQSLTLIPDLGIEGDCHYGATVQHRSRLHIKPPPKNLRQVHLMDWGILQMLDVKPGDLGENVTTEGIDLLALGEGTRLHFLSSKCRQEGRPMSSNENGSHHAVETGISEAANSNRQHNLSTGDHPTLVVTGLRNPCPQISHFRKGLQESFIVRDEERKIIGRKAGIMSTVEVGGVIEIGMKIVVEKPEVHKALVCV
jgi:hypothetical protein